jgi:hypothetical protein
MKEDRLVPQASESGRAVEAARRAGDSSGGSGLKRVMGERLEELVRPEMDAAVFEALTGGSGGRHRRVSSAGAASGVPRNLGRAAAGAPDAAENMPGATSDQKSTPAGPMLRAAAHVGCVMIGQNECRNSDARHRESGVRRDCDDIAPGSHYDDGRDLACARGEHVWMDVGGRGVTVEQECQFCAVRRRVAVADVVDATPEPEFE